MALEYRALADSCYRPRDNIIMMALLGVGCPNYKLVLNSVCSQDVASAIHIQHIICKQNENKGSDIKIFAGLLNIIHVSIFPYTNKNKTIRNPHGTLEFDI